MRQCELKSKGGSTQSDGGELFVRQCEHASTSEVGAAVTLKIEAK